MRPSRREGRSLLSHAPISPFETKGVSGDCRASLRCGPRPNPGPEPSARLRQGQLDPGDLTEEMHDKCFYLPPGRPYVGQNFSIAAELNRSACERGPQRNPTSGEPTKYGAAIPSELNYLFVTAFASGRLVARGTTVAPHPTIRPTIPAWAGPVEEVAELANKRGQAFTQGNAEA
jgi:hypothetical protein